MTCKHCYDANDLFDLKTARKEKRKYSSKGPKGVTNKLVTFLSDIPREGKSLLDIGGGIGILQIDHLSKGGARTTDVDASIAYLEMAKELAVEKGFSGTTSYHQGDFVDDVEDLGKFSIVTLDKVVCCYPDFRALLKKSMDHSEEYLALSFPMGGPIAKLVSWIGASWMTLKGSSFRPYIHPRSEIETMIIENGFSMEVGSTHFPWRVQVYKRLS